MTRVDMELAPIAFFAYKRPEHTAKALKSLSKCELAEQSRLFIFCDGPKSAAEQEQVQEVRRVAGAEAWAGKVELVMQEKNLGLANSIISGTSRLCEAYGRVIVVEDDLIFSPHFLRYMNLALDKYQQEEKVIQISGYMFPVALNVGTDAIFLPFITSWGWATWERAWRHFDPEMSGYSRLKNDKALRHRFDLHGAMPYFDMLELQLSGKIDSWGIRWYLSTFLLEGLTLYPGKSLVRNIGCDGSGTHCSVDTYYDNSPFSERMIEKFPEPVINTLGYMKVINYLNSKKPSLLKRILVNMLKKIKLWDCYTIMKHRMVSHRQQ